MKKITVFSLSFFLVFGTPLAYATTLIDKSFKEIVMKAGEIFEAEVIGQYSEATDEAIYTYVTFRILHQMKGGTSETTRTLRFKGGEVGGIILTVHGMPTFEVGQRVILFVKENITDQTISPIVGWIQGKFTVETDSTGTEVMRDGLGMKITGFDSEKGELVRERLPRSERPVPVVVGGSSDRLISPLPQSGTERPKPGLSKDAFKAIIGDLVRQLEVVP